LKKINIIWIFLFLFIFNVFSFEYKSGQKGIVRTVFTGNEFYDIKVEIVNTFHSSTIEFENTSPSCEIIIIKSLDEHGFVAGCSGSPLIIDEKIVGAVSHAFSGNKNKLAVVLPIEYIKEKLKTVSLEFPAIGFNFSPQEKIYIDSYSEYVLKNIKKNIGLNTVSVPNSSFLFSKNDEKTELSGGSPVMISIVSGDMNIGVLGTVTENSENRVFALGHRAFGKGPVNYFLQNAYIIDTIYDEKGGYKIGVNGNIKGMIYYDSNFGVVGEVGKFPLIIPLNVEFYNNNINQSFLCHIVKNNDILLKTFDSVLYQALDRNIEKKYDVRVSVNIGFEESGFYLKKLNIENIFFKAENDMEAVISSKIMNIIRLLIENPFIDVNIAKINIKVENIKNPRKKLYFRDVDINSKNITVSGIVKGEGEGKIIIKTDVNLKNGKNDLSLLKPVFPLYSECVDFKEFLNKMKDIEYDLILKIRNNDNVIVEKLKTDYFMEDFENEYIF